VREKKEKERKRKKILKRSLQMQKEALTNIKHKRIWSRERFLIFT
jgi:hypothetical protein